MINNYDWDKLMSQSALYNYEKVKNDIPLLPDVLAYYDAEYERLIKKLQCTVIWLSKLRNFSIIWI